MAALLELEDVDARYGPIRALARRLPHGRGRGVRRPARGERRGQDDDAAGGLGHGARHGEIRFAGAARRTPAGATARLGVAHVPRGAGVYRAHRAREPAAGRLLRRDRGDEARPSRVLDYFPWLGGAAQQAGTLSGGEQQMLALARALVPPAAAAARRALARARADRRRRALRHVGALNEERASPCSSSSRTPRRARASSRAYVLEVGRVAIAGTAPSARVCGAAHEGVRRSYLRVLAWACGLRT